MTISEGEVQTELCSNLIFYLDLDQGIVLSKVIELYFK